MSYSILSTVEMMMQLLLIYIAIYLVKKYVFLEPELEKTMQRKYHIVSLLICLLGCFVLEDGVDIVLLLLVALNISIARKEKRIRGFFLIVPMIGFINGIMAPIRLTPTIVFGMTKMEVLIYSIVLYTFLFMLIALFYFKAKKWRIQFEEDMKFRSLEG